MTDSLVQKMRRLFILAVAVAASSSPAMVRAQSGAGDVAAAEALFDEGRSLMHAGKYREACEKFAASQRLDAGVGTLIYLADCYEKDGRSASAWATFREAASAAKSAGQAEREKLARDRAAKLESKLSRITIRVPAEHGLADLEVRRNGERIDSASWGSAVPVDAGHYTIQASAPNRVTWSRDVEIADGGSNVGVEVPLLESEPATPASSAPLPPPVSPTAVPTRVPPPEPVAPPQRNTQRVAGWIVTGVGSVAAGTGIYFWQRGHSKHEDALSHCTPRCDDSAASLQDDAKRATTIGNVVGIAGAALVATGVVLVLTAPHARVEARIELRPGSASLHGAF
jgi:tetratricopeptide (TPR) repeat protein